MFLFTFTNEYFIDATHIYLFTQEAVAFVSDSVMAAIIWSKVPPIPLL